MAELWLGIHRDASQPQSRPKIFLLDRGTNSLRFFIKGPFYVFMCHDMGHGSRVQNPFSERTVYLQGRYWIQAHVDPLNGIMVCIVLDIKYLGSNIHHLHHNE